MWLKSCQKWSQIITDSLVVWFKWKYEANKSNIQLEVVINNQFFSSVKLCIFMEFNFFSWITLSKVKFVRGFWLPTFDIQVRFFFELQRSILHLLYLGEQTSMESKLEDVAQLMRSTGKIGGKRPPKYPESFFRY